MTGEQTNHLKVCDNHQCRRYRYLLWATHRVCPWCGHPAVVAEPADWAQEPASEGR